MSGNIKSQFASPRRSEIREIERQRKLLIEHYGLLETFFDAVSEMVLIVNRNRQIVFYNSAVSHLIGLDNLQKIQGLRPGEALNCVNSCMDPGGCGTSEFCRQCGAVKAILSALSRVPGLRECRLLKENAEALDLLVRTTPLQIENELFSIVAIMDISNEKRRRALERVFFHDVMNTVSSVSMFAEMLCADPDADRTKNIRENLLKGLNQLTEELYSQKELLAAESNELEVRMQPVDVVSLIGETVADFRKRFPEYNITVCSSKSMPTLNTDRALLNRILKNMLLNAIEESRPEETITVSCGTDDGNFEFHVHNQRHIPEEVRHKIFQRSFSTKGSGRGFGTYSMKLLSERYLNGTITVTSFPGQGTTFSARYPL